MIRIGAALLDQINAQAERAYPGECCGLLAGRTTERGDIAVTRVVSSPNVAMPPIDDRFEVDPRVRFALMRALDGSDETIVGHYHSHPDHPAEPSSTDLDMAFEPDLVWLITAVVSGHAGRTRAWRLDRERRTTEPLELAVENP